MIFVAALREHAPTTDAAHAGNSRTPESSNGTVPLSGFSFSISIGDTNTSSRAALWAQPPVQRPSFVIHTTRRTDKVKDSRICTCVHAFRVYRSIERADTQALTEARIFCSRAQLSEKYSALSYSRFPCKCRCPSHDGPETFHIRLLDRRKSSLKRLGFVCAAYESLLRRRNVVAAEPCRRTLLRIVVDKHTRPQNIHESNHLLWCIRAYQLIGNCLQITSAQIWRAGVYEHPDNFGLNQRTMHS